MKHAKFNEKMQTLLNLTSPFVQFYVVLETHEAPLQFSIAKEKISDIVNQLKLGGWQVIPGLDEDDGIGVNTDRMVAFWWQ